MIDNEIAEKLKEMNNLDVLVCTDLELDNYLNVGLLLPSDKQYITRYGKFISVDVIKSPKHRLNIDLSNIISISNKISIDEHTKKIYYMSKLLYEKYKEQNLIITKGNNDYFRIFENELWLIKII